MQDNHSTFDPNRLPNEMLAVDQFVNAKIEHIGVGKTRKVPKSPHLIGRHAANTNASTTNPATWASIDQAIETRDTHFTEVDGIGFVFRDDDPWLFIDLDNVRDPETGIIAQWAVDLIEKFPGTYVEISRSGKGLHLIIRSGPMLPPGGKSGQKWNLDNDQAIEIYWGRRYVWLTTNLYNGPCAHPLPDHSAQVRALWDSLPKRKVSTERNWGEDEPTPGSRRSNEEIIAKAEAATNGTKFRLLRRGEWKAVTDDGKPAYGSQSEADQAFVAMLSFWTGRHAGKIYELVKASGMYREKWDRDDYRENTIEGVLATREPDDFYRWPEAQNEPRIEFTPTDVSAFDLLNGDYGPKQMVFSEIHPVGTGITAGPPKIGKACWNCSGRTQRHAVRISWGFPARDRGPSCIWPWRIACGGCIIAISKCCTVRSCAKNSHWDSTLGTPSNRRET